MTEDEAKKKWCPFYRVGVTGEQFGTVDNRPLVHEKVEKGINAGRYNPTEEIEPHACCIGRRCMAWHWASPNTDQGSCDLIGRGYEK